MDGMEQRIVKIEQEITILTNAVDEIKNSIGKIDESLRALINLQTDTRLLEQQIDVIKESTKDSHKRIHQRIDNLENTVSWVAKVIIGALMTGAIGTIFFIVRKVI